MNEPSEFRARVFISCGQRKNSDEVSIAAQIRDRLHDLGFDPYVAVRQQTLRGLKENIFDQLSNSEYFVFVDFRREALDLKPDVHRGSLFCHQELAIASYLDIPVLALQESGVKTNDGILGFIQANPIAFADRHLLANVVADEIRRLKWDPHWRNELVLEREDPHQYSRTLLEQRWTRFFHINVRNRHRSKIAKYCCVYLENVTKLDPTTAIPVKQIEFCWAGTGLPAAHVFPKRVRPFDAFFVLEERPSQLRFNAFATATDFIPRIDGEGCYELEYVVVSDNFPEIRSSFRLTVPSRLDAISLAIKP